jgi:protein SOK2
VYPSQTDMSSMHNGYASQQPVMNGSSGSLKRSRDDEDDRPTSGGGMGMDPKRRKTMMDGSMPSPTYNTAINQPSPAIAQQRRR